MTPEEFRAELRTLEERWADEINAHVAKVAAIINPLPVREDWIESLKDPTNFITRAHMARVEALELEYYPPPEE